MARTLTWRSLRPPDWMEDAACVGSDPDMWQPPDPPRRPHSFKPAIKICASCPVISNCRDYVETMPVVQRHGVWAGRVYSGASR